MPNIKIINLFFLISFASVSYSQEYRTYKTDSIPEHSLIIRNDTLCVSIPQPGLFPTIKSDFLTSSKNDTLHVLERIIYTHEETGINRRDDYIDLFVKKFENSKVYIKSANELLLINYNRSYFKRQVVDSLIASNTIVYVNGTLFKVPEFSELPKDEFNKVLEKPKKAKINLLNGKEGFEKYGLIGVNGIIEISDKKKQFK